MIGLGNDTRSRYQRLQTKNGVTTPNQLIKRFKRPGAVQVRFIAVK